MDVGEPTEAKTAVNLRIRSSLNDKAKRLGLSLSQTREATRERELSRRAQDAWVAANRKAIGAYNPRIEERGPVLSAFRSF